MASDKNSRDGPLDGDNSALAGKTAHTTGKARSKTIASMGMQMAWGTSSTRRSTVGLAAATAEVHTPKKGTSTMGTLAVIKSAKELVQDKASPEEISDGNGTSASGQYSAATIIPTWPRVPPLTPEATADRKGSASRVPSYVSMTVTAAPGSDGNQRTAAPPASASRSGRRCDSRIGDDGDQGGSSLWQRLSAGINKGVHPVEMGHPAKPDRRGKIEEYLATAPTPRKKVMASKYCKNETSVKADMSKPRRPSNYHGEFERNVEKMFVPSARKPVSRTKRTIDKKKSRDETSRVNGVTRNQRRKLTLLRNFGCAPGVKTAKSRFIPEFSDPLLSTTFGLTHENDNEKPVLTTGTSQARGLSNDRDEYTRNFDTAAVVDSPWKPVMARVKNGMQTKAHGEKGWSSGTSRAGNIDRGRKPFATKLPPSTRFGKAAPPKESKVASAQDNDISVSTIFGLPCRNETGIEVLWDVEKQTARKNIKKVPLPNDEEREVAGGVIQS